jgi:hypothetical protein
VDGKEVGGVIGHGGGRGIDLGGIGSEFAEVFEEVLAGLPFGETGAAPVADVLFVDGVAVEKIG